MEVLADLISEITEFMRYFAPGYLFLSAMNFAAYTKREEKIEYLFISCITLSFVLSTVCGLLTAAFSLDTLGEQFILILIALLSGFLAGRLSCSKWVNNLSDRLFRRNFSDNLFVELKKITMNADQPDILVRFTQKDDPYTYEGQILHILYPEREPVLVLAYCVCRDENNKVIFDRSKVKGAKLVVNYADIQRFEYFEIQQQSLSETEAEE